MNRFFSKLDLRDIKIDPESTRFPPDDDEVRGETAEVAAEPELDAAQDRVAGFEEAVVADVAEAVIPASENGQATPEAMELIATHQQGDEVLKVSARSRPSAVAGAIAGVVREYGRAEVQAIGAGATNQAVKAAAIARDYLKETGIDAVCLPAFIDVRIDNEDRTAMRLVIEPR
jgi:stage V sporulation protein S